MKIALFIPCLVNHWVPSVGIATVELLEKLGHRVEYPMGQTCCGQPMTNSGCFADARKTALHLLNRLKHAECDAIVCPSASCVVAAKENFYEFAPSPDTDEVISKLFELTEFLHDQSPIKRFAKPFAHPVSLQMSCHGLRMLHLAVPSEIRGNGFNKLESVLSGIEGLEIRYPEPSDECCGFGGSFIKDEAAVSGKMGKDKARAHVKTGARYVVGFDPSCLMHLEGVFRHQKLPIQTRHVAEVLNAAL